MKRFAWTCWLILVSQSLRAGETGGAYLEVPSSVRAGGVAESYAALADEPFGIYYNPAGLAFVEMPTVSLLHQSYVGDLSAEFVGAALPWRQWVFGLAPSYVYLKDQAVLDGLGQKTSRSFDAYGYAVPLAAARRRGEFALGAGVKYYSESIGGASQSASTADAGAIWKRGPWSVGLSAMNLIGDIGGFDLPRTVRLGGAYRFPAALVTAEWDRRIVRSEDSFHLGAEVPLARMLVFRAGYRSQDLDSFAGGLGLALRLFRLDYAFTSHGVLGNAHRVGLSIPLVRRTSERKPAVRSSPAHSLAVIDFEAVDVPPVLAKAAVAAVRDEFQKSERFAVADAERTEAVLREHAAELKSQSEVRKFVLRVGRGLDVSRVVMGTVARAETGYKLALGCMDSGSGRVLGAKSGKAASGDDVEEEIRRMARDLIRLLLMP